MWFAERVRRINPEMKRYTILFLLCILTTALAAQTKFTERVQNDHSGGGSLTLHQSQSITDLVNAPVRHHESTANNVSSNNLEEVSQNEPPEAVSGQKMSINGYRIQVYSGNNSRAGKNEAAAMGRRAKEHFGELSVYTHFKTPHWICRVGDFRTMEEATSYLNRMRATGCFPEAVIVRSKISIYY